MKIIILLSIVLIFSCKNNFENKTTGIINDSLFNEAKWVIYYLNYNNKVISVNNNSILDPLMCEMEIKKYKVLHDTIEIYFSLFYKDTFNKYRFSLESESFSGVGLINGKISYPISYKIIYDFLKNKDSTINFMLENEKKFLIKLRSTDNYYDNIWLKDFADKK